MLREDAPLTPAAARQMNPLQLAFLGDAVWTLLVRQRACQTAMKVRHMHDAAVSAVNAAAQAAALRRIEGLLGAEEADIVQRGRNRTPHHPSPRHQDQADYQAATGLEALTGYLYLTGQEERLLELFRLSQPTEEESSCPRST